jgi:hypothetical protein
MEDDISRDEAYYIDDDKDDDKSDDFVLQNDFQAFASSVNESIVKLSIYFFGATLAMVVLYTHNYSIPWAIGHSFLSWGYVLYFAIFK